MDMSRAAALIVFLLPLAYSPGPGNAFFASVGAGHGLRGAMPSLIGYHVATFVVTLLIGLGLEVTVLSDPRLLRGLSLVGGLYVVWLGIAFLRAPAGSSAVASTGSGGNVGFVQGAMVLLLNPKAYVIIGLLFTQFLTASANRFGQVFAITTIFTLNNLVAFIVWTLAGAAIAALWRGDNARRALNLGFGLSLIGVGFWMLAPALP